jgi:IclR family pca regulon transcriptional regulator
VVGTTDKSTSEGRYRIQALAKGLQVLDLFSGAQAPLRTREIAELTGLPMPTTFRIVATLEEFGYLERLADGSVRPGLAVLTLGTAALRGSSLLEASDQPLRRLADTTGETINLGVLTEDRVLYLARLRNADLVTANVQVGSTLPAVFTSMGKLLLAYLPEDELARRLGRDSFRAAGGPNAVRTLAELRRRLRQIRHDGYAIQDQELAAGLRSVAVPVYAGGTTPVAALNLAVSAARHDVDSLTSQFLAPLQAAAADISLRLTNA